SVFVALAPVAAVGAALTLLVVPESRAAVRSRFDRAGLLVSSAGIGVLVYTVIEGPSAGWLSARSLAGYAATVVAGLVFVAVERRAADPMLDVSLFRVPAFSAASGSVTIAFFALYGFIFLVTQYMQLLRGWGTLSTGLRILPVAAAIAVGSAVSPRVAARYGSRAVVVGGLVAFGAAFGWIASAAQAQSYVLIAGEMVLMGLGLGLTTTPATESILSVLPPAKAGVGSAVNDATREAGGTLGVAVIGSVFSTLYVRHLAGTAMGHLPAAAAAAARRSVGAAEAVAHSFPAPAGRATLVHAVGTSFMHGFDLACVVCAGVCLLGAVGALRLPGRRVTVSPPAVVAGDEGVAVAAA
ncbi:MAG TPA: MFS transporter, partial [Acidimicrobiales bacterium]|nr:MFS transporter [Acidimicrobiales bacterium]